MFIDGALLLDGTFLVFLGMLTSPCGDLVVVVSLSESEEGGLSVVDPPVPGTLVVGLGFTTGGLDEGTLCSVELVVVCSVTCITELLFITSCVESERDTFTDE